MCTCVHVWGGVGGKFCSGSSFWPGLNVLRDALQSEMPPTHFSFLLSYRDVGATLLVHNCNDSHASSSQITFRKDELYYNKGLWMDWKCPLYPIVFFFFYLYHSGLPYSIYITNLPKWIPSVILFIWKVTGPNRENFLTHFHSYTNY